MSTDLVVVYSPVGGGHKSAALATAEAARARGLTVQVLDAFDYAPKLVRDATVKAHLTGQSFTPELYGEIYFAANRRASALEPLRLSWDNLIFGKLTGAVLGLSPRAVVATHHLPLVVLGRARRKGWLDAPLLGVVTDYTAHAYWAERGVDAWAVPLSHPAAPGGAPCCAAAELARHGVDRSRIVETGIPVRRAFEDVPPAPSLARPLRVLVTSGGFGHGPMARIVRSFASVPDVELTIVCGANAELARRVEREADASGVPARVLGFEKDMAARVAEAHVVVGKAGGLTVTETLTAGRPMIIASAVPGNEKLNETFVVEAGAGVAAEADRVGAVVEALRDADLLAAMGERARSLVPCSPRARDGGAGTAAAAVVDAALARVANARRAA